MSRSPKARRGPARPGAEAVTRMLPVRTGGLRTEMQRALFEDVRPGWEEYLTGKELVSGSRRAPAPGSPLELLAGMFRATFDDVRPGWEEHSARKDRKLAA